MHRIVDSGAIRAFVFLVAGLLVLVLFPLSMRAQGDPFFDHFSGTSLDGRWATATAGNGMVCVNGTPIAGTGGTCSAAANGQSFVETKSATATTDAAIIYSALKIDTTRSQMWTLSFNAQDTFGKVFMLLNSPLAPTPDLMANISAEERIDVEVGNVSGTKLCVNKYDAAHARQQWSKTTNTWTAPGVAAMSPLSFSTYYTLAFEIDGPNGRWRIHGWGSDGTGFTTHSQGYFYSMQTDWVSWSSMESTTDLWLVLGDPYTDSFANNVQFEYAKLDEGPIVDAWLNGQMAQGNLYDIRHVYGLLGADAMVGTMVPQDRATVAISAAPATWEVYNTKDPYVVAQGGMYYMLYDAKGGFGIATATSVNGPWTKSPNNPVLANSSGNELFVAFPNLVMDVKEPDATKRWKILYEAIDNNHTTRYALMTSPGPPDTALWTKQGIVIDDTGPPNATIATAANGGATRDPSGNVTVTTIANHGFTSGMRVLLSGVTGCSVAPNGKYEIQSIPTPNSFVIVENGPSPDTCGSGTVQQADHALWNARPILVNGLWYMVDAYFYFTAPSLAGPWTKTLLPGASALGFGRIDLNGCDAELTANAVATRTITVTSTAGCVPDGYVIFDQDPAQNNWLAARVLSVESPTQLTLYERIDGLTTATPARVRGFGPFQGKEPVYFVQTGPQTFLAYQSCYYPFANVGAAWGAYDESNCVFKSTTGLLGDYSLLPLASPVVAHDIFGHLRSAENLIFVNLPTPSYLVLHPSPPKKRR